MSSDNYRDNAMSELRGPWLDIVGNAKVFRKGSRKTEYTFTKPNCFKCFLSPSVGGRLPKDRIFVLKISELKFSGGKMSIQNSVCDPMRKFTILNLLYKLY